ncbi:hypothetical protein QJQ45_029064 [Haematococcus lacustris]|nr:hypothetical protein QJQ45_029064 [Haematococcus lacustris]
MKHGGEYNLSVEGNMGSQRMRTQAWMAHTTTRAAASFAYDMELAGEHSSANTRKSSKPVQLESDAVFLAKLAVTSVTGAAVIKYGSLLTPFPFQPSITVALAVLYSCKARNHHCNELALSIQDVQDVSTTRQHHDRPAEHSARKDRAARGVAARYGRSPSGASYTASFACCNGSPQHRATCCTNRLTSISPGYRLRDQVIYTRPMVLQNTSGFERRQCELEKRREILRQAREKAEQPGGAAAPAVADAEDTADESDASSRRLELPRNLKATDLYEEQVGCGQAARAGSQHHPVPGQSQGPSAAPVLAWVHQLFPDPQKRAAKALKAPLANPLESSPLNFSLPAMPEKLSDIKPPDLSNLAKDLSDLKDKGFSAFDLPEAPPAPSAPAPAPPATTRIELPRYQAAQPTERRQILSTPDPAPPAAPAPPAPAIPSPAQPPAPTPLPTKVVEPASVKNAPQTAVTAKAGKRRGPLPLPVAQLLELGLMAGFVAAITKYNDQTTKVADAVWKVIVAAYTKLESLTAAKTA